MISPLIDMIAVTRYAFLRARIVGVSFLAATGAPSIPKGTRDPPINAAGARMLPNRDATAPE